MIALFAMQKFFNFMRFYLLIDDLSAYTNGVLFRKYFIVQMGTKPFFLFSSIGSILSGFILF